MIVYTENPIGSTKILHNLISAFGKTAGYKVNIEKLKAFLYTNNEISQRETRGGNPIYYRNKKNKILRNKLNQRGKRTVGKKLHNNEERN